jgi:outer membrane immunogenic protein
MAGGAPFPEVHGNGRIGHTLCAGVEAKVSDNVSLLAEYSFTDLGDPIVFSNPPGFAAFDLRESMRFHTIKVGVNYRF